MNVRNARKALLTALILAPFSPLAGQSADYEAVHVDQRPRTPLVTIGIRLPIGSERDGSGLAGTAWLLGNTLAAQANTALEPRAGITVDVGRSSTLFTLSTLPEQWRSTWSTLERTLFDAELDPDAFQQERSTLSDELRFQRGSPTLDFEQESVQLLASPSSPWARPTRGTLESIESITAADLEGLRRSSYLAADAVAAMIGAGVAAAPLAHRRAGVSRSPDGPGWVVGTRLTLTQEVTSTWISFAYPVAGPVPRNALDFVAHLIQARLSTVPPDPNRFGLSVRVIDAPLGSVITVEAAVAPEAADRFEREIQRVVSSLTEQPPSADFFGWDRRRFRAELLLTDSAPERAVARITSDLLRDGQARHLAEEIWEITPQALAAALLALGEPRILRLGPDLEANDIP